MRTFKLTLEYDGTDFSGWQIQKNAKRTVQGEIEKVLKKIFKVKRVPLIASGRTDRGVHARGQVAHFRASTNMPCDEIMRALNSNLPRDITILEVEEVVKDFHAQFDAKWKTYSYTVVARQFPSALLRRISSFCSRRLNVSLMRREAKALIGHKDLTSFANVDRSRKGDAVRTIRRLDIRKQGDLLVFTIESNGFLYKMVRNIVGTLLEIGAGRFPEGSMVRILNERDRRAAGTAAEPQGLCLERVEY